jgi:hypothetical protein
MKPCAAYFVIIKLPDAIWLGQVFPKCGARQPDDHG